MLALFHFPLPSGCFSCPLWGRSRQRVQVTGGPQPFTSSHPIPRKTNQRGRGASASPLPLCPSLPAQSSQGDRDRDRDGSEESPVTKPGRANET